MLNFSKIFVFFTVSASGKPSNRHTTSSPAATQPACIRKLVKFYIMPIMTEQNALNYHCANAVNQVSCYVQENSQIDIVKLASRVDELELKLTATKLETDSLRTQVKALKSENARLKKNQGVQK